MRKSFSLTYLFTVLLALLGINAGFAVTMSCNVDQTQSYTGRPYINFSIRVSGKGSNIKNFTYYHNIIQLDDTVSVVTNQETGASAFKRITTISWQTPTFVQSPVKERWEMMYQKDTANGMDWLVKVTNIKVNPEQMLFSAIYNCTCVGSCSAS
jgi:hypothetical protein